MLYQLLGAALLTPVAAVLAVALVTEVSLARVLLLWAACLPASALVACLPLVPRLEVIALSELLGVAVPDRADPVYLRVLTALHLFVGATLSAGVLALAPAFTRRQAAQDDLAQVSVMAVAVLAVMVLAGAGQQRVARRLLRSDPSLVIEELGRRQSLALELHDSVGHALSVVLVQAMAAQAALGRPETVPVAQRSLDHLVGTARGAQQELDVLLRVLDEGSTAQAPRWPPSARSFRGWTWSAVPTRWTGCRRRRRGRRTRSPGRRSRTRSGTGGGGSGWTWPSGSTPTPR